MSRSRVVNRVAAIESSSRSPEIFQSTGGSCHLSIGFPCIAACRAVESSIGSPQSSRRVVLQKFLSRLMSPDSIEIRISDNSNNPHAAGSAGSRRRRRRSCARWCLLAPPESRTVAPQACAHPQRPAHVVVDPKQHLFGAAGCP